MVKGIADIFVDRGLKKYAQHGRPARDACTRWRHATLRRCTFRRRRRDRPGPSPDRTPRVLVLATPCREAAAAAGIRSAGRRPALTRRRPV